MMLLEILNGGLLTTVQDAGRHGYQRYGIPSAGALDLFALRAANRLVGNGDGDAALEMTLLGPTIRVAAATTLALTGADLGALLDGRPAPRWRTFQVQPGAALSFAGPRDGVRAYLAVAGGLDVPLVLGSRSTYLRSRLGGLDGRALKAGDRLESRPAPARVAASEATPPVYGHEHRLRVVLGPQDDRFTAEGLRTFLTSSYTVTPQADRMGARMAGPAVAHVSSADIVSDGTPLGAVQVAGDGMPIVLLADRGTAGGYTKIATVVSADIWRVAQAAPGDTIRFEAVTVDCAIDALREQEAWLDRLRVKDVATDRRERAAAAAAAAVTRYLDDLSHS